MTMDLSIRPLSKKLQEIAIKELNEVPERIPEDLKHLKEWLSKQHHLKCRMEDQWLLTFMRGCKFNLQKTKEKLDVYYAIRKTIPEFYEDRDVHSKNVQASLDRSVHIIIRNPEGNCIYKFECYNRATFDEVSIIDNIKATLMTFDILLNEEDLIMGGLHIIADVKDLDYKYVLHGTPPLMKKIMTCLFNVYPLRIASYHIINAPSYFVTFHNTIVKPFLPEKMKNRVHVYGSDLSGIYKIIPKSLLPKDYGGDGLSIADLGLQHKKKIESYRDWFLEDFQYCTDESKRLESSKRMDDIFGIDGSFRKLNVD